MADPYISDEVLDPPLADHIWFDADHDSYVVTFLPDPEVSEEATEVVVVPAGSPEGRIIRSHLRALADSLGFAPLRIVHSGAGDFAFHQSDGSVVQLSDASLAPGAALSIVDELKAVAEAAQCAFRIASLTNR